VDLTLSSEPGPDIPPFLFKSTASLIGALASLPITLATPIANRIWLDGASLSNVGPGIVAARNSDVRGGGSAQNLRGQQPVISPNIALTFADVKRIEDLSIESFENFSVGGLFVFREGNQVVLENVTIFGPANGSPGPSPMDVSSGSQVVMNRCVINNPGIIASPFDTPVTLEGDNVLTGGAFQPFGGGGSVTLVVNGDGNWISPGAAAFPLALAVDIGGQYLSPATGQAFSGADSLAWGAGSFTFVGKPAGTAVLMYPGAGNSAMTPPIFGAFPGPPSFGRVFKRAGVVRGLNVVVEGVVNPGFAGRLEVEVYQGGVGSVLLEVGFFPSDTGDYKQNVFGFFIPSPVAFDPNLVQVVVREDPSFPTGGIAWDSINVSFLVK